MSAVEDHFNSIDAKLEAARLAWEADRKVLEDQLLAAQLELKLQSKALADAIEARSNAERTTAKLIAQFGMVSQVFEDAKELAIEAGLYKESSRTEEAVEASKSAIDRAVMNSELAIANSTMALANSL